MCSACFYIFNRGQVFLVVLLKDIFLNSFCALNVNFFKKIEENKDRNNNI